MSALPLALAKDTILDCICEIRFPGVQGGQLAGELLPGMIFGALPGSFDNTVMLPVGQIPQPVRDMNPQLRYLATHGLEGKTFRMMVGPHVAGVSFPKPYPGWARVRPLILKCMQAVLATNVTGQPERIALKYVNLLNQGDGPFDLSQTKVQLSFGEFVPKKDATAAARVEIERNQCITVVEIASGSMAPTGPNTFSEKGVTLSVDTIHNLPPNIDVRAELPEILDRLHNTEKEIFFGLLAPATLEKLGPVYPTKH